MAAHPGKEISRKTFWDEVWRRPLPAVDTGTLRVHISTLRKKLPGIQIIAGRSDGSYMLPASELAALADPEAGQDNAARLLGLGMSRRAELPLTLLCRLCAERFTREEMAILHEAFYLTNGSVKYLSRSEKREPRPEMLNLPRLITAEWAALAPLAGERTTMTLEMPPEAPRLLVSRTPLPATRPSEVMADREILGIAINNIMSRVILYSPAGTRLAITGREQTGSLELEFLTVPPANPEGPPLVAGIVNSLPGLSAMSLAEVDKFIDDLLNLHKIAFQRFQRDDRTGLIMELPLLGGVQNPLRA